MKPIRTVLFLTQFAVFAWSQPGILAPVISKPVSRTIDLPGELFPFMNVALHAKLRSYVDRVLVDRGSVVKEGDLLVELSAPELAAQIAEAESKVAVAEADRLQAEVQLAAVQSTYERTRKASETPGVISGNELIQAEKQVEAAKALIESRARADHAARAATQPLKDMLSYLKITAPFDGVVTERLVHPGALVGTGSDPALLVIQQVSHLRLVVDVPEEDVRGIADKATVTFRVPAYTERGYSGLIARNSHTLDHQNRTMAVELDVFNRDGSLAPGMYPTVRWPVRRSRPALFVPKASVVTTTERVFVIRDRDGRAEWVDVRKGLSDGDLVEVIGNLHSGDMVVRRGTDELRDGMAIPSLSK